MLCIEIKGGVLEDVLASRASSRTHFKVLGHKAQVFGFGLEAYKSSKMSRPSIEDSIISWLDKKENNQTNNNLNFKLVDSFHFFIILKNYLMW